MFDWWKKLFGKKEKEAVLVTGRRPGLNTFRSGGYAPPLPQRMPPPPVLQSLAPKTPDRPRPTPVTISRPARDDDPDPMGLLNPLNPFSPLSAHRTYDARPEKKCEEPSNRRSDQSAEYTPPAYVGSDRGSSDSWSSCSDSSSSSSYDCGSSSDSSSSSGGCD